MTVLVQQGTLAAASAKVTVTVTKSDGSSQQWSLTSNGSGVAKQTVKIANNWPRGTYTVTAVATKNQLTATGRVSFTVN